jgi:hypothetical protein
VNTGCADLLPKIGYGVKANELRAAFGIHQQDVENFEQHIRF